MDLFAKKQREISINRQTLLDAYPQTWSRIMSEWRQPGLENQVWLTYSANYLFQTGGLRWALDPLTPYSRLGLALPPGLAAGLQNLQFVLLSHRHADHLDAPLIAALRDYPIQWVIPEFLQGEVIQRSGLSRQKIMTPRPGEELTICGLQVLPFTGNHWETLPDGSRKGVPAMGYRIKFSNQVWLFPGDTRTYDPACLPEFEQVDGVFAHLWLGRAAALLESPPLLEDFCRFQLALQPKRIILTHMHEVGRDAAEYWNERHVNLVIERLLAIQGGVQVTAACSGQGLNLARTGE